MKVGNGTDVYSALEYVNLTPSEVQDLISEASHTHSNKAVLDATTASFTTALQSKLNGIAAGAEVNVQSDWERQAQILMLISKTNQHLCPHLMLVHWAKEPTKPTYTAAEVGADPTGSAATALSDAKEYADTKISGLSMEHQSHLILLKNLQMQ